MKRKTIWYFIILLMLFSCKANSQESKVSNQDTTPVFDQSKSGNIISLQEQLHIIAKNETAAVVSISTEKIVKIPGGRDFFFDPFDFFFFGERSPRRDNVPKEREFKQGGLGSGVIYKQKGDKYYILTNNHVVEGVDKIKITVEQNKSYNAKLLGTDPDVDIAVLEISTKDNLRVAKIGDSDKLQVGDFVIAIGNPYGLQGTMTFGIISALGRSDINTGRINLTNFIQTDAAINPGNSGGPLLNINGEVIGINTLIYTQSGGNIGIGFAIPINIAKRIAEQIIEKGKVEHGWLGIYFEELNEEKLKTLNIKETQTGMLVTEVISGSPAEKAGIQAGDILVELNGKKLVKSSDLVLAIGNFLPGTKVKFKILRDNKFIEKEVVLGSRSEFASKSEKEDDSNIIEDYGIKVVDLTDEVRARYKIAKNLNGVLVTVVEEGGTASYAGIKVGDVIYKVNNNLIKNVADFNKAIKDKNVRNYFFINRNGREFIVIM